MQITLMLFFVKKFLLRLSPSTPIGGPPQNRHNFMDPRIREDDKPLQQF